MNDPSFPPDPRRLLQIYDPQAQINFQSWTAKDKLEWLEAINQLYWAGRVQSGSSTMGQGGRNIDR